MNASVCSSSRRQLPGSAGESRGRRVPSTSLTGLENVSVNWRLGPITLPGVGLASSCGYGNAGNQLTRTGAEGRSHVRAAAATSTAPVLCVPLATSPMGTAACACGRRRAGLPASATRLTGVSNATVTWPPGLTCSQRPSRCALGVSTVNLRRSVSPTSQAAQPGRRTVSSTDNRSPLPTVPCGTTFPARTVTGTFVPLAERTTTPSICPAKRGSTTRASASPGAPSRALGQSTNAEAAPPQMTTASSAAAQAQTRARTASFTSNTRLGRSGAQSLVAEPLRNRSPASPLRGTPSGACREVRRDLPDELHDAAGGAV